MTREFLRIGTSWMLLYGPNELDERKYLFNSSGTSIKIKFSDIETVPSDDVESFTIGGLISKIRTKPNKYIFARACSTDLLGEAVLVSSDLPTEEAAISDYRDAMDVVVAEVFKLSQRVTTNELNFLKQKDNYYWFLRRFVRSHNENSSILSKIIGNIVSHRLSIFTAERWMAEHTKHHTKLEYDIEHLSFGKIEKELESIATKIIEVNTSTTNLASKLDEYIPRIEEAWSDYDDLVKEHIDPMKTTLDELHTEFLSLNNSLVKLGAKHTPEEIETVYEALFSKIPESMQASIATMKNMLVEISVSTHTNILQNTEIEGKVGRNDYLEIEQSFEAYHKQASTAEE